MEIKNRYNPQKTGDLICLYAGSWIDIITAIVEPIDYSFSELHMMTKRTLAEASGRSIVLHIIEQNED
jgi:hypothetical protein